MAKKNRVKPVLIKVRLGDIDISDDFFQIRVTSNGESIPFLRELVATGLRLEAAILRKRKSGKSQIIAGFQRVIVWLEKFGPDYEMEFWVYEEDFPDSEAMEVAIKNNCSHGRPLTMTDRRNAVRRMLEVDPTKTDAEISEKCFVTDRTVANQRKFVPGALTKERVGRDGKLKKAKAQGSNKDAVKSSVEPEQSQHADIIEDPQLTLGLEKLGESGDDISQADPPLNEKSAPKPSSTGGKVEMGLMALSMVCRMQAREFVRRAEFIDRILPQTDFSKAELEMLQYLAQDVDALSPEETVEWFEKTTELRSISHLLSELLASKEEREDRQNSA